MVATLRTSEGTRSDPTVTRDFLELRAEVTLLTYSMSVFLVVRGTLGLGILRPSAVLILMLTKEFSFREESRPFESLLCVLIGLKILGGFTWALTGLLRRGAADKLLSIMLRL